MDRHRSIEHGHVGFFDPTHRSRVPGVVEKAVEPPEGVHGQSHRSLDVLLLRDIGVHKARLVTELIGNPLAAVVIDVGHDDGGALANEEPGRFLPDTTCRAGDDSTTPIEPAHGVSPIIGGCGHPGTPGCEGQRRVGAFGAPLFLQSGALEADD
jgi:hypothetical protein